MKTSDAGMETRQNHSVAASDIKAISLQLRESNPAKGAYCQNYDAFISVYRF